MKFNTGALIILCLITTGLIVEIHQEIEQINFPFYFYLSAYYLRAIMGLICIYYGVVEISKKFKNGIHYLVIGLLFSIFSIGPSITSLYTFNSIELSLLPIDKQAPYLKHIIHQKYFLAIICLTVSILTLAFCLRKRKIT